MRRSRRTNAEMNVVPYIDVMLVLLVIFMVTAPLLQPGVVNLPKVGQAAAVEQQPLEIVLNKSGRLSLRDSAAPANNRKNLELDELADVLTGLLPEGGERPVVISADGKVRYEEVMRVVNHLQKRKIARVGLMVSTGE